MRITIVVLALMMAVGLIFGCGDCGDECTVAKGSPEAGTQDPPGEADPGGVTDPAPPPADPEALLKANCTSCHAATKVTSARMDHDGWAAQVEGCMSMNMEAELSSEDSESLVEHLAEKYGK